MPQSKFSYSALFLFSASVLCGAVSCIAFMLYLTLYWPYRLFFDSHGRYLDETTMVVYQQQSGLLILPALVFLLLALVLGRVCLLRRKYVR